MLLKKSITLIGMAGSGKSTIAKALAKKLNLSFIDSDRVIEQKFELQLQQILNQHGYLKLRDIEARIIQGINLDHAVLATGGSAVYSSEAMEYLARQSSIIYLQVPLSIIYERVNDFGNRGFAKHPDQSIEEVFKERVKLYENFADIVIENISSAENCIQEILKQLA
jgi:shikimate kinase